MPPRSHLPAVFLVYLYPAHLHRLLLSPFIHPRRFENGRKKTPELHSRYNRHPSACCVSDKFSVDLMRPTRLLIKRRTLLHAAHRYPHAFFIRLFGCLSAATISHPPGGWVLVTSAEGAPVTQEGPLGCLALEVCIWRAPQDTVSPIATDMMELVLWTCHAGSVAP